jgi:hypothetical protein
MTGIGWLDTVSVVAFAAVTVLALLRLARDRTPDRSQGLHRCLDDGFHAVMGVVMTAMFWPGNGHSSAWVAVIGLVLVWPLLVFALATRRPGPPSDRTAPGDQAVTGSGQGGRGQAGREQAGPGAAGPGPAGRPSLGHTGYWLACAALMLVVVGAGHGSGQAGGPGPAGGPGHGMPATMPAMIGTGSGTVHPAEAGIALGPVFQVIAEWPIWPLVGAGFLVQAGVILLSRRRPITERACAAVMAAGMAAMALSL